MGQDDPGRWSQHGPDYDAFDLVATINLAYDDTTDSVYPLLFEGIGPTDLPPVGFLVVDPFNYHMGLDWLNIVNDSTDPATVSVRIYLYSGDPLAPYGTAGPVVWSEILLQAPRRRST